MTQLEVSRVNFVVVHDFFDTLDSTRLLWKPIVNRHMSCQALTFNYPGQAGTTFTPTAVLNNEFLADRLHELLMHVDSSGQMLLASPFHLVGIGNGASIAMAFCHKYGASMHYRDSLRSLVTINGFASVDPQLAAILHSTINVYSSLPDNRPDLPVSYFSRFLFSEEYLRKVDPNLALNIYTAVCNPITLEGRIKICKGALVHKDMSKAVQEFQVPVVVVQSTEDMLVNAANVDPFIEGRETSHLWSHQLHLNAPMDGSTIGKKNMESLLDSIATEKGI